MSRYSNKPINIAKAIFSKIEFIKIYNNMVLLDLMLSGITGEEVLSKIKKWRSVPDIIPVK
ncbi:hypothetical protein SAMN05446037_100786 [Anaerovirgula multivorans]|uniref:Uncharacterized protein n=1 Tax=Anaerovirgula multivorans TaxID=312168 RepID=A0A239DCB0_9FIRM|nr:response regulator transcription factor [Anaerovirgula multivorans]SNS29504.1 hypothetical protein SAMN05446037_100786 [Anaerovirgula multivorans]